MRTPISDPASADRRADTQHPRTGFLAGSQARILFVSSGLIAVLLLILAAPALAGEVHVFEKSFGGGELSLAEPSGLAVNQATHDVYVADAGNGRVAEFEADGTFIRAFGSFADPTFIAIDNSPGGEGDVYVADSSVGKVFKFDPEGNPITSWGESGSLDGSSGTDGPFGPLAGIAVGPAGNLFVYQNEVEGFIFKFTPDGGFTEDFQTPFGTAPFGIAVDSSGAIYKVRGNHEVAKLTASGGVLIEEVDGCACATAIAIDPADDDLYVAHTSEIVRYSASATRLEAFGSSETTEGALTSVHGVAVGQGHLAYVGDLSPSRVDVFPLGFIEPPAVSLDAPTGIGYYTAHASGTVNPEGHATTCRFEYVTEAHFQAEGFAGAQSTPCVANPGSGTGDVSVEAEIAGLDAGTTYNLRLAAMNVGGTSFSAEPSQTLSTEGGIYPAPPSGSDTCPNAALRAGTFARELPDCRAPELVSATGNYGEPYYPTSPLEYTTTGLTETQYPFEAADNGEAVTYLGEPPAIGGTGFTGSGNGNQWLATRTLQGWDSQSATPDTALNDNAGSAFPARPIYQAFSPDLSWGIFMGSGHPLASDVPVGCLALYSRATETGAYSSLFNLSESPEPDKEYRACGRPLFAGASQDGSQVIFQSEAALTPEAVEAPAGPPRYGHENGETQLGTPCAFECNLYSAEGGQLRLINALEGTPVPNASFGGYPGEAPVQGLGMDLGDLSNVISEDGSRIFWTDTEPGPEFEHVYVFESGTNVPVSEGAARYWTATPNGRYAFYTEAGALWKFDTNEDTREEVTPPGYAGVLGVIGVGQASENGQYVYYVAEGVLANNANAEGETPTEGSPNLYLTHAGVTTFIATLSYQDNEVTVAVDDNGKFGGDWTGDLGLRTAAVSSDGRHLVFESSRALTGYENSSSNVEYPVRQVYIFSADDGALSCASCNPAAVAPTIHEATGYGGPDPRLPVGYMSNVYTPRWMSADGNRVFFNSIQPLSPSDTNGVQDVYEWERQGAGSCTAAEASPLNGGCVFLLSAGDTSSYSFLIDAATDGNNVFLEHVGPLGHVKARSGANELYDLRVDGGFEEASSESCSGEGCREPSQAVPLGERAGSEHFEPEPEPERPCRKGFVKRHGKCVRKHRGSRKRHRHQRHPNAHEKRVQHDRGGSK